MNTTTTNNDHCIDVCNSLLRGELSAVETYHQAIEKFESQPETTQLTRIRDEHSRAVGKLRGNIAEMGGKPSEDSGAWGVFANSVQGAANLFGESSAVAALQQGEEHGLREYEEALEDDEVMTSCKNLIRSELLPKIREHIACLERIGND